jgi:hypothetical protein
LSRSLSLALVLALLSATAIAFAVTERLKLEPVPITRTTVTRTFSPVCRCKSRQAVIAFRLRRADRVTLAILDARRRRVRVLASSQRLGPGKHRFVWNGRTEAGQLAPDGTYRVRVELAGKGRTINLPNLIVLDTVPPKLSVRHARPSVFSPDSDGHVDSVSVRYHVSEPAHAVLFVDGRLRVRGRFQPLSGALHWYGIIDGRSVKPGRYRITLAARDLAGNLSNSGAAGTVLVRYVKIVPAVRSVRAGKLFKVHIATDAKAVSWKLNKRHGHSSTPLVLRAPAAPGRYVLTVSVRGHDARAVIHVRAR